MVAGALHTERLHAAAQLAHLAHGQRVVVQRARVAAPAPAAARAAAPAAARAGAAPHRAAAAAPRAALASLRYQT